MNKPSKQELEQLKSLGRQLNRLAGTTDSLYRRLGINGRERNYVELARNASVQLKQLAGGIDQAICDA
ncbi:hypothetical protein [Paenibacillus algicola]|uniref:hypothetical protein n=1 Tax=Paenibacillus algicola TaxID=2565926 RepID=UPI0010FF5DBF|nr:hypothetical protein [Paenibacillus algicola]